MYTQHDYASCLTEHIVLTRVIIIRIDSTLCIEKKKIKKYFKTYPTIINVRCRVNFISSGIDFFFLNV